MRYRIQLTPDEDTLLVTCPDLPEVVTFGDNEIDATVHASDAIISILQARISAVEDIPEPTDGDGVWVDLGEDVSMKVWAYRTFRDQARDIHLY